jgi:hypothetical protein
MDYFEMTHELYGLVRDEWYNMSCFSALRAPNRFYILWDVET